MPKTREKLIELLGYMYCTETNTELADHLIANGVTVQSEIDANTYQLTRECERLKEEKESLANAVNVLEEINSDLFKQIKGVTVQEWISVKDRLPEVGKKVLVYCKENKNDYDIGAYSDTYRGFFVRQTWYENITHWMPLPEPPKEATP